MKQGRITVLIMITVFAFLVRPNPVVPPVQLNGEKDITSFMFTSALNSGVGLTNDVVCVIKGTDITVTVPWATDVTALKAAFSTTGASVKVGSTIQVSGITANDFSNAVTCLVKAADLCQYQI